MSPALETNGTHDDHGSATLRFKRPSPENFNRIWRGDKQGTVRLDGIPSFESPYYEEREWNKVVLDCIFSLHAY